MDDVTSSLKLILNGLINKTELFKKSLSVSETRVLSKLSVDT